MDNQDRKLKLFLKNVSRYFKKHRDLDTEKSKKDKDKQILEMSFRRYLEDYRDGQDIQLANADEAAKSFLFNAIITFTDKFYYDSNGATLFSKNISEAKNEGITYQDIINN